MPTPKHANTGIALSRMIQTAAKIRECSSNCDTEPSVFVRFPTLRDAEAFNLALARFAVAAKSTVKNVRARQRENRRISAPLHNINPP